MTLTIFFGVICAAFFLGWHTSKVLHGSMSAPDAEPGETALAHEGFVAEQSHEFEVFGTRARLEWTPGGEWVHVHCITHFVKGEPKTQTTGRFRYHLADGKWEKPPRGAAREVTAEIERVVDGAA
jgi:predicted dehydrogenase